MRNLNGYDINGRTLRVDYATTEKNKEEMKALQTSQAPTESPYGLPVEPHEAPEAISKAVASLPPEQMFELMKQMKIVIQNNPVEARNMLLQNPQLAYALLQAQVVMRIVSPEVAMTLLHKQNDAPQPIMPPEQQQAGPSQNQPQPVGPPQGQPQPIVPPQNQHPPMGHPQPNHGSRGPNLPGMQGPEPGMAPQRMAGTGLPVGMQGRSATQQAGMPVMMQQQASLNEPRYQDGRGPPGGPGLMGQGPRQGPGGHGMMMMQHHGEQGVGRGGIPMDQGGPMDQDPIYKDKGRRGGSQNPMGMPPRQGAVDPRGGMDPRGPPIEGHDPRRQGYDRHPEGLSHGQMPPGLGNLPQRLQGADPRGLTRGLPMGAPGGAAPAPNQGGPGSQAQPTPQDQEKAALIMQVLGLSNEQINSLPSDQRQSILLLKEQLARSQGQIP
ncbi:Cleavage stimulation factor subunit 2 [Holothuria leucospilota]|uniref:Cleavage stimulation factor subunit 2 n=1 Tax=Holothuria leucospilota TaxID=206669 RepID=A0A9Q0YR94_HOLLE|nr:Cleavage stimulation factor subunit 2 [Holothuria leucospilota]